MVAICPPSPPVNRPTGRAYRGRETAQKNDVRAGATVPRTPFDRILLGLSLSRHQRGGAVDLELLEAREADRAELCPQRLDGRPDRGGRPGPVDDDDGAAGSRDPGDLVEERDHVQEQD